MFTNFFQHLDQFEGKDIFKDCQFFWSPLKKIEFFIKEKVSSKGTDSKLPEGVELQALSEDDKGEPLNLILVNNYLKIREPFIVREMNIFIDEGTVLEPTAIIKPNIYIGKNSEIRQGAYLRGNIIVGEKCVIGHTTEIKNSIMMNHSEAGHFNYIGDSIIGSYVNLGAGVKLANLQFRAKKEKTTDFIREIKIKINNEVVHTGFSKLGAIIGDFGEIGCNAVTNPGVLLESNAQVFPNMNVKKGLYKSGIVIQK